MAMNCVDASNWTDPLSAAALADWKASGIELVIVQAIDPPAGAGFPPCVDRQQAQAILDAGLALGCYVYHWVGTRIAHDNAARFASYGFPVERWWGDFEDTTAADPHQREAEIPEVLAYLDTLGGKRPAGAYTGGWWVVDYLPAGTKAFSGRVLWLAKYDGVAELDQQPIGGADSVVIKQFTGTGQVGGVRGVDRNVAAPSEFLAAPDAAPAPGDADPCADVRGERDGLINSLGFIAGDLLKPVVCQKSGTSKAVQALVAGIRAQADAHGIKHA